MNDHTDFDLRATSDESTPPLPPETTGVGTIGPWGIWVVVGLLLIVTAVAAYFVFGRHPGPAPATAPVAAPSTAAPLPEKPLGGEADSSAIPPLDASDAAVRTLVRALSESPAVVAWLSTDGLIRNFTVVVGNIAEGVTPVKHLKGSRPASPFQIITRDRVPYVDPRSYDRYSGIADAIATLDPAGTARLYATVKPRVEEANRELGSVDQSFDRTLEKAIVTLLKTPIPPSSPPLKLKGIGYAYADDRLEDLTAAQKQLLRMGPRNVRIVKDKLRAIAVALGIPADRLPPA
jgi:hypothetical protein